MSDKKEKVLETINLKIEVPLPAGAKKDDKPEVIEVACDYDKERGTIRLGKKPYEQVLDQLGVTPEVRKVVVNAMGAIDRAALPVLKDVLLKDQNGESASMTLGQGAFSKDYGMRGQVHHKGKSPATGLPYETTKYGVISATTYMPFDRELRAEGGLCNQVANECEAYFKKK